MPNKYTQHGMPPKKWLDEDTVFGLNKNELILIALVAIIIMGFFRLNWDQIVAFW